MQNAEQTSTVAAAAYVRECITCSSCTFTVHRTGISRFHLCALDDWTLTRARNNQIENAANAKKYENYIRCVFHNFFFLRLLFFFSLGRFPLQCSHTQLTHMPDMARAQAPHRLLATAVTRNCKLYFSSVLNILRLVWWCTHSRISHWQQQHTHTLSSHADKM